jgi:hypothetical protein
MLEGVSEIFTTDILTPDVEMFYPTGNESFDAGQVIPVMWESTDESTISDDAVDVLLSVTVFPVDYFSLIEGQPNSGYLEVELP